MVIHESTDISLTARLPITHSIYFGLMQCPGRLLISMSSVITAPFYISRAA